MMLSCHQCRKYLTAYVNNELTPRARRRVETHLNTCHACSAAYLMERRAASDITSTLARIGIPNERQLSDIWAAVLANVHPTASSERASPERRPTVRRGNLRYGAFALVLAFALIAPTMFLQGTVHAQIPDPPTPLVRTHHITVNGSPVPENLLAAATAEARSASPVTERTIAFQSNTAPTPGATDSP